MVSNRPVLDENELKKYVRFDNPCPFCGSRNIIYKYHGIHVGADCGDCRRHIKFIQTKKSALKDWEKAVKGEYGYTCAMCGRVLDAIEARAHHKLPKALFPQYALDIDNGICLCDECHQRVHGRQNGWAITNGREAEKRA